MGTNRRIHTKTVNFRIPYGGFRLAPDDHPERSIANNDEPECHRNEPVEWNQSTAGLEHNFNTWRVYDKGSQRRSRQDAIEGGMVCEHVLSKRKRETSLASEEVEHLHRHDGPVAVGSPKVSNALPGKNYK